MFDRLIALISVILNSCDGLYPLADDFMTAAIIMKGERK